MRDLRSTVVPQRSTPTEARFHDLLVAGLARIALKIGKGRVADRMGRSVRQLDNIMGGSTPGAKPVFDALLADETALDELLAEYGFRLCPLHAEAANDLVTAAGVIGAMGQLVEALSDGRRDHLETLAIATLLRPHMPAMTAIVREADELRSRSA